ncbi:MULTISPECIES: GIY-YIG nuclease family protein [unclassified Colwellia]|uniref:GIY-YIG nuclease family protein n=1 Tax=unclassified Colwellia TaxID=196834 RepID=UPI0015F44533|nr:MULTISPECIES: GIY-YIG nuclease family protein [unclassified Colwellia]MBA6364698.1 GIY-YIG nuclease family protein [Colwellia sp. BRX8-8]MBA6356495.1 GIY-YIG nuclease family protein [Colwellia sp. BRX8-3]MBA6361749.1 GIY-YIG nuclease family protein [Colwellia sp. BRX8-6]MBA6367585.1 GIY-YIG nuclease family protein [Colwellia sp. BRX8-5]MBA6371530.1 GIY-YIG nuclease family protein [Colwellia sp. BRX8-4]
MSYIDNLIANCEEAKVAKPTREFVLGGLLDLDRIKTAIYVIEQVSGDISDAFNSLSNYKATKDRACPALNAPSKIMYVGSSTTGVKSRIKQHIGDGHKGTYALHLKHWFKGDYKITIMEFDKTRDVLQIIEDDISERLSPAFGKKGGNNK